MGVEPACAYSSVRIAKQRPVPCSSIPFRVIGRGLRGSFFVCGVVTKPRITIPHLACCRCRPRGSPTSTAMLRRHAQLQATGPKQTRETLAAAEEQSRIPVTPSGSSIDPPDLVPPRCPPGRRTMPTNTLVRLQHDERSHIRSFCSVNAVRAPFCQHLLIDHTLFAAQS